jgi:hypothetical protein
VDRQPLKKLSIDEHALLKLLLQWRSGSERKGYKIGRITVAFEVGHDSFWLARWLTPQGIEHRKRYRSRIPATVICLSDFAAMLNVSVINFSLGS